MTIFDDDIDDNDLWDIFIQKDDNALIICDILIISIKIICNTGYDDWWSWLWE